MLGLNSPLGDFLIRFGERPCEIAVEDISFRQMDLILQVDWAHRLDAGIAICIFCQTAFDLFIEILINAHKIFCQYFVPSALVILLK